MRALGLLLFLGLLAAETRAHGSAWDPPDPPDPPRDPPPITRPPPPPPTIDPEKPPEDQPPTTPPPMPGPPPPTTPGYPNPHGPNTRVPGRPPARTRGSAAPASDWRLWWEYNRASLTGLRGLLRRRGPTTGPRPGTRDDPLGERRAEVVDALRAIVADSSDRTLRAAAILALGRLGDDADIYLFARLLKDGRQPQDVHEASAVALGLAPTPADPNAQRVAREYLAWATGHRRILPARARGMAIVSAGLRGREDPLLRMQLVGRLATQVEDGEEAAHLALACGLSRDLMVVPELIEASRKGRLGSSRLTDVERAHVVCALARTGDPGVASTLLALLRGRSVGIESRRSAAMGLGRLLREESLDEEAVARAARALSDVFDKSNDVGLRGYAAVALGGARPPHALALLQDAIDRGGSAEVKPYCALALGLAARTLGEERGRRVRRFLANELDKTNDVELGSALSIALGLARATESAPELRARASRTSLSAAARGAAAQALGLLGEQDPENIELLITLLRKETSGPVLEDAALALGLLGHRSVARELAEALSRSSSAQLQGRMMLALAHLDHSAAVEPLLAIVRDSRESPLVREFACVALGLLGDRREQDALFDLDADFNYNATTRATNEIIRLY